MPSNSDALDLDLYGNRPVAPTISYHDVPFCNRNVHMREHLYYKIVHCEILV